MALIQYLKDTRSELNHVAWPTRMQTIVFTALVILLSALIAVYLGFFDYVFTTGLGRGLELLPQVEAPTIQDVQVDTVPVEETPAQPTE